MTPPTLSIITEPVPSGYFFFVELFRQILKSFYRSFSIRRERFTHRHYGGHPAVTRSIVEGLQKTGANFNYNPRSLKNLSRTVHVPGGLRALRQMIEFKRLGLIDRLTCGPNIVVFSTDEDSILASPEIDGLVNHCDFACDIWIADFPKLSDKCFRWPAGVDPEYWSPSPSRFREKTILIFNKCASDSDLPRVAPYVQYLTSMGWRVEVLVRSQKRGYEPREYRRLLRGCRLLVGFTVGSESQGIAWSEAWSCDIPTLILRNDKTSYRGRDFACSTAPYLVDSTGLFFNDFEDFKIKFEEWQLHPSMFSPRAWVLDHLTDQVSATQLFKYVVDDNLRDQLPRSRQATSTDWLKRVFRLSREGGWIVIGNVISALGALMLLSALTGELFPSDYGDLALCLTFATLTNQVVTGGLASGFARYLAVASEHNDLNCYFKACIGLMHKAAFVVTVAGGAVSLGLAVFAAWKWAALVGAVVFLSVVTGYNASFASVLNAARMRFSVAVHSVADAWIKIPCALGAIFWFGPSGLSVILGFGVGATLVCASYILAMKRLVISWPREKTAPVSFPWAEKIWHYSLPISLWGVFTWAYHASDRWALSTLSDDSAVGLYAVAFQMGYAPVSILSGMAVNFLSPILFQQSGSASDPERNQSVHRVSWQATVFCIFLSCVLSGLAYFFHENLYEAFLSPAFQSTSYLLPWMVFAGGIFSTGQVLALKLLADMKTRKMLGVKIITALVGVFLNFAGASVYGMMGVVYAQVLFSTIYLVWMMQLSRYIVQTEG